MCLIITLIFTILAIKAWSDGQGDAALLYGAIALVFAVLMGWNIKRAWQKRKKAP